METLRNLLLFLPNAASMMLKCAQLLRKLGDDTTSVEIMKYCMNFAVRPSQTTLGFIMNCLCLFLAIRSPLMGACANFQVKECMPICNVCMIYLHQKGKLQILKRFSTSLWSCFKFAFEICWVFFISFLFFFTLQWHPFIPCLAEDLKLFRQGSGMQSELGWEFPRPELVCAVCVVASLIGRGVTPYAAGGPSSSGPGTPASDVPIRWPGPCKFRS